MNPLTASIAPLPPKNPWSRVYTGAKEAWTEALRSRLARLQHLPYRLLGLRHGQSLANRRGLIASNLASDVDSFGLTAEGMFQVRESLQSALQSGLLAKETVIISSPFLRTRESAFIAATILRCDPPRCDRRLREREFGRFNHQSAEHYHEVWNQDQVDTSLGYGDAEAADQVLFRMTDLLLDLSRHCRNKTVLIVSHGDPLNMLLCGLERISPSHHREKQTFVLGEIREVFLSPPRVNHPVNVP